ncbi:XdhC family protein [Cryptosporangium minutisporangium]|uniref:XdhC Rossmann domain-containing protein n=1 Tax=Cryptosporangium minutisporangium TaxID=113569 RepID=A0ABP6SYF9_9ACTN
MREIGRTVTEWLDAGHRVAVARVVDVHGFGAVPVGEVLAVRDDGARVGELLHGVADPVISGAVPAALSGEPSVVRAPVSESDAVAAGLACAGSARVLVHAAAEPSVWAALAAGTPVALVTSLTSGESAVVPSPGPGRSGSPGSAGPGSRSSGLSEPSGSPGGGGFVGGAEGVSAAVGEAARLLATGATSRAVVDDVLVDAWVPTPTVVTVGGGVLASALAAQASLLGWSARDVSSVADAVAAVSAFGPADVLVLLNHDPAMDEVLRIGLAHGRGFLGALGSRRTQAARRERLRAAGVPDEDLARIHGPVGLDLGARSPAETAVSIVAEVLATRSGRAGTALRATDVAIH